MRHNHSSHRRIPPTFDELLSRVRDLPEGYEGHILEGAMFVTDPPSVARAHTLAEISAMVVAGSSLGDPVPDAWAFLCDVELAIGAEGIVTADVAGWRVGSKELASAVTPVRLVPEWVCEVLGGDSSAGGGTAITVAVLAALSAVGDVIINKARMKYPEGDFAGAPEEGADKHKRKINMALLLAAMNKVRSLISTPKSPAKCVKLNAPENLGAMAGREISIYGTMTASLGAAWWATVTSGVSSSLAAVGFAGVGGAFASMKGYRKVEIGSDWGKVFIGGEKDVHLEGEKSFTAGADNVAHVASPSGEGHALFGGGEKVWMGTTAGGGWGLLLDDAGLALGAASGAGVMKTVKIKDAPSLRVVDSRIEFKTKAAWMKLAGDTCTIATKDKKIRFEATSGPVTINGAKILLK
jgi:hypothetical protein